MSLSINVTIKTVYGNETIYPNCPISILMAKLAGTKTLTRAAITIIKSMGYTVNVVQATKAL